MEAHLSPQMPMEAHPSPQTPMEAHLSPQVPMEAHLNQLVPTAAHLTEQAPTEAHQSPQAPMVHHNKFQSLMVAHLQHQIAIEAKVNLQEMPTPSPQAHMEVPLHQQRQWLHIFVLMAQLMNLEAFIRSFPSRSQVLDHLIHHTAHPDHLTHMEPLNLPAHIVLQPNHLMEHPNHLMLLMTWSSHLIRTALVALLPLPSLASPITPLKQPTSHHIPLRPSQPVPPTSHL